MNSIQMPAPGPHATSAARDLFEDALERVRQRYRFVVAGYVVMPEQPVEDPGLPGAQLQGTWGTHRS